MQTLVITSTLLIFYTSLLHVSCISMNVRPPSGSLIVELVGAVNTSVIECEIFEEDSSGGRMQLLTVWTLRNFRSSRNQSTLVVQSEFEGVLSIEGAVRPPELQQFSKTYRNRILVLNFLEDFDGAELMCGYQATFEVAVFELRIYRAPLSISNQIRVVKEGTSVSINLSSQPEAFPLPRRLQWSKNDVILSNSSSLRLDFPTITFPNVSRRDNGNYTLVATNYRLDDPAVEIGTGTRSFKLNVLYGPDITRGPAEVVNALGSDVTLLCGTRLASNPPAIIRWTDNNGNSLTSSMRVVLENGPSSVSLTVKKVTEVDAGEWNCILEVSNVRTLQIPISLIVVGPPSEPRDVVVVSTGATWAHLSWREPVSPASPPSASTLYTVTATRRTDGRMVSTSPSPELSSNVTGLLPSSEYNFTVTALSNVGGVQASSMPSTLAFTTTTTTVPELQCDSTPLSGNGTIHITWRYIHTGGLNLTNTSILYSLAITPLEFRQLSHGQLSIGEVGSPNSFTVRELSAGNSYIFKVTSSNERGSSSTTCPPVTHEIGIPDVPLLIKASSLREEVTLTVRTKESGTQPPDLFQFNIRAQHIATLEGTNFTIEARDYIDGENVSLTFGGVLFSEEGNLYQFTVSCSNRFGTSKESNSLSLDLRTMNSAGAIAGGVVGAVVVVLILVLLLLLFYCIYKRRKYREKKEKRRFNSSEHMNNIFFAPTPTLNGRRKPQSHDVATIPPSQASVSSDSSVVKQQIHLQSENPQHETIPVTQLNTSRNSIYDTLAPFTNSNNIAPPSPSTPLAKFSDNALYISGSEINRPHSATVMASYSPPRLKPDSARKSSSIPDCLDSKRSSLDLPAGRMEPISINRDILELEERYNSPALEKHMVNTYVPEKMNALDIPHSIVYTDL